jgi:dTDP-4-dehydrorhamnose 3,5-epimerase
MNFIPTSLEGCFIIEPDVFRDDRGWFMESFNEKRFADGIGQQVHFVQDNQSFSSKGVLRGLHYQAGGHAQAKLVRALQGTVLDVAVDIRPGSPTFGKYESVLLSAENQRQFFVPRGFAHGFQVITDTALFFYKCDNFYNKESEGGIRFDDPSIGIRWEKLDLDAIVSEKDRLLPTLTDARKIW